MKKTLRMLTFLLLLACLTGACKKEMFDGDKAKKCKWIKESHFMTPFFINWPRRISLSSSLVDTNW